jgi:gliding motility-associated-like protein
MKRIFTFFISAFILTSTLVTKVKAQDNCEAWIPRDATFSYAPFTDGAPPYYRNDDGSTNAIPLPFNFCLWGQNYSSVYINTNGNISFGAPYSTYSPDSFPSSSYQMIAPFWGDVYLIYPATPGSNVCIYKIQPHYMIVQWDSVAYFSGEDSIFDSFQVIISDGTDPIIPHGNNVSFAYRKMQWTTGNASLGHGGFGGYPATVGANEGDDVRYIQIGLFDQRGSAYPGQFPPPPNYDGVAWLDNQYFIFNLCAGSIAPLIGGVTPCDTFRVCEGDSTIIPFYFFTPVQGDSVWSHMSPPVPPGVTILSNHPGHTDSLKIKVVGSGANIGYHTVNIYGYDNAHPSDTTYTSFVVEIDSAPRITLLSARRDTICAGDTSTLSAAGGLTFLWSTGGTTSSIKVWPATTESYTVGVANGGCVKDSTIRVNVLPQPSPHIIAIPDSICQGDSVQLNGSGGTLYTWSNGKTTSSIKVAPTISVNTYTLTASNGICANSIVITIPIIPRTTATISAFNDTVCPHGNTTITAAGSGGQLTYKWNTGETTATISVNDTVTTTYTATVYGLCDSVQVIKTVNVVPLPKPVINGSTWECHGIKDTLSVSNSTGPATYLWSNGNTTSSYKYTGPINADSTIYLTAENSLGCPVKDSFKITVRIAPKVNIKTGAVSCGGNPAVLKAIATGTNGPFTYTWLPAGIGSGDSVTVTPDSVETYTVTVSNGCTTKKLITVTPESPLLSACCNTTIQIGNTDTIKASGTGIVAYTWSPNTGLNCDTCANVVATPTVTTTYTVTGTDSLGCPSTRLITITVEVPCYVDTIPNVFTPTSPGPKNENSVFYINTQNLTSWSLLVYDRWGKEMFQTTNPKNYWDGNTESGGAAPAGVYYYILNATCPASNFKKQGFIQLIR